MNSFRLEVVEGFASTVDYSRNFYNAKTIMQKSDNARVWASTEFVPI